MKIFTCSQPQSLQDFTDSNFPQGSFVFARLIRAKDIKVNGVRVGKNIALNEGDEVVYYTTTKQESAPTHYTVYEDSNIYVADKFSGVSSEGLCAELNTYGAFYPIHRLDRNTCGLIVYAKNSAAETGLLKAFKDRKVTKTYILVCKNNFKLNGESLTAYLKKDEKSALVSVFDRPTDGAKKIVTEYKVLESAAELALVSVVLHTGRTHQIRAHMAHIGCPVLGDNKYGDAALNKKYSLSRQCLISKRLRLDGLSGALDYLNGKTIQSKFGISLLNFIDKINHSPIVEE